MALPWDFLLEPSEFVAPRLLGCYIIRELAGQTLIGKIVETEAYDQTDEASHSYRGQTPRTDVMFGPPGRLYVYFTYGRHYCANVVTGKPGYGAAALIRAVEPLKGRVVISRNRRDITGPDMTNGPAKLCQAFGINKTFNGHDLRQPPLQLLLKPALPKSLIIQTKRIGISRAQDKSWRFYIKNSAFVS